MAIGHCFSKLNKYCHPSEIQMQKQVDRTGKKYINYINTDEIQNQVSLPHENFISSRVQEIALPRLHNKSRFCASSEEYHFWQKRYPFRIPSIDKWTLTYTFQTSNLLVIFMLPSINENTTVIRYVCSKIF